MEAELKLVILPAIVIGLLIIKKFNDVEAELRVRFGRLGRQIDRLGTPLRAEPCDIVLTQGHTFLSRAIRCLTRGVGESRTQVHHVGIVVQMGCPPAEAIIIEAGRRVKKHSLGQGYGNGRSDVAIFRPTGLTSAEKQQILGAANKYVDCRYGYLKIMLHLLDALLMGFFVFRRLAHLDRHPICSWLVAHSFEAAGKDFGLHNKAATPDDIWDFVKNNPQHYTCIRELRPL